MTRKLWHRSCCLNDFEEGKLANVHPEARATDVNRFTISLVEHIVPNLKLLHLPGQLFAHCADVVPHAWQSLKHQCRQFEVWQQVGEMVDHGSKCGEGWEGEGGEHILVEYLGSKV